MKIADYSWILWVLINLLYAMPIQAQENKHTQFDFWIGEWDIAQQIIDSDGTWLEYQATTKVQYILEEHVIIENWSGEVKFYWSGMEEPQIMSGYSMRYYDEAEEKWFIYWMDSFSPVLGNPFTGTFSKEGRGNFYRTNETPNGTRYSKITFDQKSRNNVMWELEISYDQKEWNTIWIMDMTRK